MDVNDQLHNSTTLPLGRVPGTHWIGGWVAPEPICTFWRTRKSPASARNQRSLSWSSTKQPSQYAKYSMLAPSNVSQNF